MPAHPTVAPATYIDPRIGAGVEVSGGLGLVVRDGTPPRIAGLLIGSAALLAALKLLGFRFNVGVST